MNDHAIPMLDLFSGIGGFALAAEIANAMADAECPKRWPHYNRQPKQPAQEANRAPARRLTAIAHAEVEPFACAVYHRHFPDSVCFGGIQNVTRDSMLERCGTLPVVVTGGFPCQPHSCAGKRLASADDRDLWGECRRVLGDLRPRYALFENVAGLLTSERGRFFNRVLSDLAALRYACVWQVVPASAVGAPHRRERVWIICRDELADSHQPRPQGRDSQELRECGRQRAAGASDSPLLWPALSGHWPSRPGEAQHGWEPPRVVGDTAKLQRTSGNDNGSGRSESIGTLPESGNATRDSRRGEGRRQAQSPLGNDADGLPSAVGGAWPEVHNRVAQLKGAGNAIVPQVAAIMLNAIRRELA